MAKFPVFSRKSPPTQSHPEVTGYLNTLLAGELTARGQYFIHSRMYEDQDFGKLYEHFNHKIEEETRRADALLCHILLSKSIPRMYPDDVHPGTTVPKMLKADLKLEHHARAALTKDIVLYEQHKDFVSHDILKVQLTDTEENHAYWLG